MAKKIVKQEIEKLIAKNQFINSEHCLQRIPLYQEQRLLNNIRTGNYQEIFFMEFDKLDPHTGKTTANKLKKFEYYAVSAIALGSRAAIDGGLAADIAYDIADVLIEQLAVASGVQSIHEITLQGLTVMAYQVYKYKRSQNSYIIEQAKVYVTKNIFQKIYLNNIAAYIDINPTYLSHLFAEKTGVTIQNYIQQEKISRACNMLQFSNNSIAEIAQYLSYQSQSHFTEVFKRYQGMTPTQYRNMYKSNAFS